MVLGYSRLLMEKRSHVKYQGENYFHILVLAASGLVVAQAAPWGPPGYVQVLTRYAGFIDGLKEGAYVKVEGYE